MAHIRLFWMVFAGLLISPAVAYAGMSRVTTVLTEMAKMRLQNLSFFLAGFLVSSMLIQLLWNALRRDVPVLPRLSYPKAVGLVGLWGLLFVLVLTMISGARELMTPGAWEPSGISYRLTKPADPPTEEIDDPRKQQLLWLKEALWQYAKANGGRFPPSRTDPAVAKERWQLPDASGMQYVYVGGSVSVFDGVPLVYEPDVFGKDRWVLMTDGQVQRMTSEELARALPVEK